MKIKFLIIFCVWVCYGSAQDCNLILEGYVLDSDTKVPLEFSNIYIQSVNKGAVADGRGYFKIVELCPREEYQLKVSHVGCETKLISVPLASDTTITVFLNHQGELIDEVVVNALGEEATSASSSSVEQSEISENSNDNISDLLETISGVSILRNGSGVSKPVVHGLYGNRVGILNNGIPQAGQKWGNDHAPEIDAFVADKLSVVKGTSALEYGGSSLGSMVLVNVDRIGNTDGIDGELNYIFESNGLGNTGNLKLENSNKLLNWRLTSTFKIKGDNKAPDYFLTNTGKREGNLAIQAEKTISEKWSNRWYYSFFNTEIGILRGSHIGNLTDLEIAIGRAEPFFTNSEFSYQIDAPSQKVQHHLWKWESKLFLKNDRVLALKYGGQINQRKEFDVRRSGRSDIPAMSMDLTSHFGEGKYSGILANSIDFNMGVQLNFLDNTNNPETGILPLIPDYRSFQTSGFMIFQKQVSDLFFEWGGRYDYKYMNVKAISRSVPREIQEYIHHFSNYSFSGGLQYDWFDKVRTNFNMGYMLRAPEINELYSFGLHQGVSGIEEGNPEMDQEKSFKITLNNDLKISEVFSLSLLGYYQRINGFIYLEPQNEYRLTIRGAFPLFEYTQADADIAGVDFSLKFIPEKSWRVDVKYSIVRGQNRDDELALINLPSDNIRSKVKYFFDDSENSNSFLSISGDYIFRQTRIEKSQDFLLPPDGYFLLGFSAGTTIPFLDNGLTAELRFENALNRRYRDYLNRQRYFADEPGINVSLRLNYKF